MSSLNNDIPQGFQMTELGLLPEEWEQANVNDLCSFDRGTEPGSNSYNRDGIGAPFIRVGNIAAHTQELIYTNSPNVKMCVESDILMTFDGSPGVVIRGFKGAYSSGIRRVIPKSPRIYKDFTYFVLKTNTAQQVIEKYTTGVTIKHASKALPHIKIPLPPLPEQKAIARLLSAIQKAIDIQDKAIAAARELKKSLMRHLFTYGPVPPSEAERVPLKETEIGAVPEHWEVVRLGEFCNFTTGKLNSNQAVRNGKYPFFTCSQETFRIDRYSFDCEAVLLSGNNARGVYSVKYYNGKFDAYQRTYVIIIRDLDELDYKYLRNVLETKLEDLRIGSIGTTTKFLTVKMLISLQISAPPLDEQKEIAHIFSTVDEKIEAEEKRKAALQTLFKTMLHLLMTGKVRIKELEALVV